MIYYIWRAWKWSRHLTADLKTHIVINNFSKQCAQFFFSLYREISEEVRQKKLPKYPDVLKNITSCRQQKVVDAGGHACVSAHTALDVCRSVPQVRPRNQNGSSRQPDFWFSGTFAVWAVIHFVIKSHRPRQREQICLKSASRLCAFHLTRQGSMQCMTTSRVNWERMELGKLLRADHKSFYRLACVASGDCFKVMASVLFDDSSGDGCNSACSTETLTMCSNHIKSPTEKLEVGHSSIYDRGFFFYY